MMDYKLPGRNPGNCNGSIDMCFSHCQVQAMNVMKSQKLRDPGWNLVAKSSASLQNHTDVNIAGIVKDPAPLKKRKSVTWATTASMWELPQNPEWERVQRIKVQARDVLLMKLRFNQRPPPKNAAVSAEAIHDPRGGWRSLKEWAEHPEAKFTGVGRVSH